VGSTVTMQDARYMIQDDFCNVHHESLGG